MRIVFIVLITLNLLYAQKIALLIGNNTYKYMTNLKNPSTPLARLKASLKSVGFKVKVKRNLKSKQIAEEIEKFSSKLRRNRKNIGFFYYTGHGCQLYQEGYLIPIDVNSKKRLDIKYDATNINKLLESLNEAGNRVNMVFLDACRDVNIGAKGSSKGLGQLTNTKKGSLVVYATKAGDTAGDNDNFINALISNVKKPRQNIRDMAFNISDSVATKTNGDQIPVVFATWLPKIVLKNGEIVDDDDIVPPPPPQTKFSLTINPTPTTAKIYIMNINPRYEDEIVLKRGTYDIKVIAKGYKSKRFDVYLDEDKEISVTLVEKKPTWGKGKWNPLLYKGKRSYSSHSYNKVKDNYTGLVWQKSGSDKKMKWKKAKSYCSDLNMRLPTYNELYYLADRTKRSPAIDTRYFKNTKNSYYWTGTKYAKDTTQSWVVSFDYGNDYWYNLSDSYFVRCVQ